MNADSFLFSATEGVFGNGVSGIFEVTSFIGTPTPPTFLHSNSGTGHRVDVYTAASVGTFTTRLQELGHTTQVGSEFATIVYTGHGPSPGEPAPTRALHGTLDYTATEQFSLA